MNDASLKSRAVVFALCAGGVAFFLALLVTTHDFSADNFARALIPAIVCGAFSWASAERGVSSTAAAIDAAIERLARAGEGDLESPMPAQIARAVPTLAASMEALFRRLRISIDSIERLAMYDTVTGLPNRAHVRHRAEQMLAERPPHSEAALLFIDLDRFKAVNDTKGHAAGDQLLALVADRLRQAGCGCGHPAPLVGRLAGDEFAMFLPEAGKPRALALGEAVLAALREPFDVGGEVLQIGASVGIALQPRHGGTLHELMRAADAAMYHAKQTGRGRVEMFTDALAASIADRLLLDVELREALDGGQFTLVFQPQRHLRDGRTVAAEALLRWRHPTQGLRLPASFLGRAEETGLIVAIGDGVVDDVARTIARWGRAGRHERLSVNVSRRQLDDPDFFGHLQAAMASAQAPARLLEVEIAESLALQASGEALAALASLRASGATVAIDGFGAGTSNLARLRAFPADRVKLDRSIVAGLASDPAMRTIAQALIGLVHGLGCEAVGEGVETAEQVELLRVLGCDVIQGYAVAAPMGEEAFLGWLEAGSAPTRAITSA